MDSFPESRHRPSDITHRRETIRYIVLPMAGLGVLVLAGAVITLLLPQRLQVSLIADELLTVLFLCPLALCLFPVSVLMIVAIVGMNRLHQSVANPLRRLEDLSTSVKDRTVQVTDTVNRQTVNAVVKFAFVDRLLAVFDPPIPSDDGNKEG